MAGGNFNSKHPLWGCRFTSPRSKILRKTITNHKSSHLAPTGPTYWPIHTNLDILDFFIYSTQSNLFLAIFNITDLPLDHAPVKLVIDGETNQTPIRSFLATDPINWTHYKKYLSNNTQSGITPKTIKDLKQAFVAFVEMIQFVAKLYPRVQLPHHPELYPGQIFTPGPNDFLLLTHNTIYHDINIISCSYHY